MIKRVVYFGYYLKKLDRQKFFLFLDYTSKLTKRNKLSILIDVIGSVFKYNISILEYFQFRFFEKNDQERKKWAGMGFMYEVIYKLNPRKNNYILNDKIFFLNHYSKFIRHTFLTLDQIQNDSEAIQKLDRLKKNKIVLKNSKGNCGIGIEIIESDSVTLETISKKLIAGGNNMAEEFVVQHELLKKLSPSGLNTLRVITLIDENGEVKILGARLRITVNNVVDNLAAGNIAAEVDENTGILIGPGVYSDITKTDEYHHPVTGVKIIGFEVPYFKEAIELVTKAALHNTSNRTVGWDIAITDSGPDIIEGNHDWCKLLWQLPAKRGLKYMLEDYS